MGTSVERAFRLDQPLPLPADARVIFPDRPRVDKTSVVAGCAGCGSNNGRTPPQERSVAGLVDEIMAKFLVSSPQVASYIVLDRELLPAFQLLSSGSTVGDALKLLEDTFGKKAGRNKLQRLLRNVLVRNFFADALTEEEVSRFPTMQMYVTNRCNLRCRHCYMSSGDALPDEVGTQDRISAIEHFARLCPGGLITFTGGEALLDRDIFKLIWCAKDLGLRVEIYSNGLTIKNSDIASRVVSLVDDLQISLDGASERVNDEIRGKGTFKGIIRAIKAVDEVAHTTKRTAFRLKVAVTLTQSNAEDIRTNLLPLIDSLGLHNRPQLRIGVVGRLGRAGSDKGMFSNESDLRLTQASIVNQLAAEGVFRYPVSAVNRFSSSCGMGLTVGVGADGKIYPCTITDQRSIGNIRDADAGTKIASVISFSKKTGVDNVEGCRDCSIRYFCGGICRIRNMQVAGSMTKSACTPEYKNLMVRDLVGKYSSFGIDAAMEKQDG